MFNRGSRNEHSINVSILDDRTEPIPPIRHPSSTFPCLPVGGHNFSESFRLNNSDDTPSEASHLYLRPNFKIKTISLLHQKRTPIMEEIKHCHSSDTFSGVQLTFPIRSEESGQRDRRIDKYILSTLLLRAPLDLTKLDITRL